MEENQYASSSYNISNQSPSSSFSTQTEFTNQIIEVEDEDNLDFGGRQIYKCFRLQELEEHNEEDYDTPQIVSFGPYYHGRPELGRVQELKHEILAMQISRGGKDKKVFYDQIFEVIDKIRNFYAEDTRAEYDDEALTDMMLLDASFAACIMRMLFGGITEEVFYLHEKLGYLALRFIRKDMCRVGNQIPLWVIMNFCKHTSGNEDEGRKILNAFVHKVVHLDREILRIPGEDRKLPLHLLDAIYRALVQDLDNAQPAQSVQDLDHAQPAQPVQDLDNAQPVQDLDNTQPAQPVQDLDNAQPVQLVKTKSKRLKAYSFIRGKSKKKCQSEYPDIGFPSENPRQFPSVTDLKAKGIHFKPSSHCLNDIHFKSYAFYGQLQLPVWYFNRYSKLLLINLIAYELRLRSLKNIPHFAVVSYVNSLQSLLLKPEDVRELRERKILFSSFESDEQVLQVIKEIDTSRVDYALEDVKKRIEDHCSSKEKVWIAKQKISIDEQIQTYFHSPWSFISLLAAIYLLVLTSLQTYYTVNPHK